MSTVMSGTEAGVVAFFVGVFAALLTSFYSWRLVFLTFFGEPRWAASEHIQHAVHDAHGHGHDDHAHGHDAHHADEAHGNPAQAEDSGDRRRMTGPDADLPGHRLIHSVKSQVQWARWFVAAGVAAAATGRGVGAEAVGAAGVLAAGLGWAEAT